MNNRLQPVISPRPRAALIFALVLAAAAWLMVACSNREAEVEPVATVQVQKVERQPISSKVTTSAVLFPLEQAVIAPKISSTIKEFRVQRGSRVHAGEVLAILENTDLSAAAEQSRGEFQQAEAAYKTETAASVPQETQKAELDATLAKSALDAEQKVYDSRKTLYDQGALPRRDLDSAEVALRQARNTFEESQRVLDDQRKTVREQSLKSAEGQLSAAEGKYHGAEAQLSYSEIRSPIDGVVTDRPLYPGELAGANVPLLTVMNLSKLIAKAHIAQQEATALKTGDSAEVLAPGLDDPASARVSLISPALDPGSSTVEVWFDLAKPPAGFRPGMSVSISATTEAQKDALAVPESAVFQNADGSYYVLLASNDNRARQQAVKTGIHGDGIVQIVDGLKEDDPLIVSGGYGVPDKTQIKIETPPPAEPAEKTGRDDAGKITDKDKD
jgi:HlyD family secretion protein